MQRTDLFNPRSGLDRGASFSKEALWRLVSASLFMSALPWPSSLKRFVLICFGAKIGKGFYLRPRVAIHFPWKLEVGDFCWIGDDCGLLNLEPIRIGDRVAIAHRVYLATGNHDYSIPEMPYRNSPITIESGVWIASCSFIGPGVKIGQNAVVSAGSVVTREVEANAIVRGNPAVKLKDRIFKSRE